MVDAGDDDQGQSGGGDEPADDSHGHGCAQGRALADAKRQRQQGEHGGETGHGDRPNAGLSGVEDGRFQRLSTSPVLIDAVDEDDRVVDGDAGQHDDTDEGHHVERHGQQEQEQNRPYAGHGDGQQDDEWVHEGFELRRHDHVNEDHGQQQGEAEVVEGFLSQLLLAGDGKAVLRGQGDGRQLPIDVGGDLVEGEVAVQVGADAGDAHLVVAGDCSQAYGGHQSRYLVEPHPVSLGRL